MHRITVLSTSEPEGGVEPFHHGQLEVQFHPWVRGAPLPLLDEAAWAFVDWLLPDMPGLEVCRRLRCDPMTAHCRITVVLEQESRDDARRALAAGANDYMVGPISRASILDRILVSFPTDKTAMLSRAVELGDLVIDIVAFQVRWRGKAIALMPNEFRLLRYLAEHPERVFTRTQLIAALGKQTPEIDERTVDVWIGRLRRALRTAGAGEPLRTVRGIGYVLDRP